MSDVGMNGRCAKGDHPVGEIARKLIYKADWDKAVMEFEVVVDDFNVRGQRDEIPHPGWCIKFQFCPHCGKSLADLNLREPDWRS